MTSRPTVRRRRHPNLPVVPSLAGTAPRSRLHFQPTTSPRCPGIPPPSPVATTPAISRRGSGRRPPLPIARCIAAPADPLRSSVSWLMPLAHPAPHLPRHVCINKDRWVAAVHFMPQQPGDSSRTHLTLNRSQFRAHGGGAAPASSSVPNPCPDCGRCTTQVHASTTALPSRVRPLVAMDLKWMHAAAGIHAPPRLLCAARPSVEALPWTMHIARRPSLLSAAAACRCWSS